MFGSLVEEKMSLPEHERPSPANPSLQVQLCPPRVLVQFAFMSQSWLPVMHSSTSILQTINKYFFNFCYKVDENAVISKVYEFTSMLSREEINRIKTLVILKAKQK